VLAFALGCGLSSAYGFLAGTWPFGAVEVIWMLIALRRYFAGAARRRRHADHGDGCEPQAGACAHLSA